MFSRRAPESSWLKQGIISPLSSGTSLTWRSAVAAGRAVQKRNLVTGYRCPGARVGLRRARMGPAPGRLVLNGFLTLTEVCGNDTAPGASLRNRLLHFFILYSWIVNFNSFTHRVPKICLILVELYLKVHKRFVTTSTEVLLNRKSIITYCIHWVIIGSLKQVAC